MPRTSTSLRRAPQAGPRDARIVRVRNFDDRISLIQGRILRTVVDRGIRQLTVHIVTQRCRRPNVRTGDGGWCIAERDAWAEVVAVFNFVRANVRYTGDATGFDTYQTGRRTLELRAGDCDDYTILMAGMLLTIGHVVRLKSIELRNQPVPGYSHIYAQVRIRGEWRSIDASTSWIAGWEVPPSRVANYRTDGPFPERER